MKNLTPNSLRFIPAALGLVFALLANHAGATNIWWDNAGTSTPTSGTWDATTLNWSTSSSLTASTVVYGSGDFVEFTAGTAGISALTITVNGTVTCAGLGTGYQGAGGCSYVTNITFNSGSSGSISISSGMQSFYNDGANGNLIFNLPLTGPGGIIQHGNGYIALNGNNNYSGGTELTGGQVVYYYNNNSFGSGTITVAGGSGALVNNVSSALTIPNNFTWSGAYSLNLAGGPPVGGLPGTTFTGNFSLPSTGTVTLNTSSTATEVMEISGIINGAAALTVADDGTLELAGTNTYTGITTITSPATLSIVGSGSLGSGTYSAGIVNGYAFIYASSTNQTLSGIISSTGTLTQSGPGTLTLSGVNTYTGATAVNGGTLLVNSPGSLAAGSAVTVGAGGTLGGSGTINGTVGVSDGGTVAPGGVNNIGTLTLANSGSSALTLNGSLLLFDINNAGTANDLIAITGTLVLNGANNVQLDSPGGTVPPGTYTLMTYANRTGSGSLTLPNGSTTMGNFTLTVGATSVTLSVSASAPGALTWTGSVNGTWDTTDQNWVAGSTPTDYIDNVGESVTFDDTASANFSVSGGTVTPGSVTFNNSAKTYINSAAIAGASTPLSKFGSGKVTLSGANTYGGVSTINAGIVNLGAAETPGTSGPLGQSAANNPGSIVLGGGTLQYSAANLANDYSGRFSTTASQAYKIDVNGQAVTFATPLTSSGGALTLSDTAGGGKLTLTAANTYSGPTTLSGGIANAGVAQNGSTSGPFGSSGTINLGGGTLQYSAANQTDYSSRFSTAASQAYKIDVNGQRTVTFGTALTSSGGALTLSDTAGGGNLTLTAANTYSGGTTINSGATLTIGGAGTLAAAGAIPNNGTFAYTSTASQALSGIISGTGKLVLNSSPTLTSGNYNLTLSGANTYSGTTTINGGILQISSDGNLGAAPGQALANSLTLNCYPTNGLRVSASFTLNANRGITLGANGGSVHAASGDTLTYAGIITGPGNFSSGAGYTLGYGTVTLNGLNTYQGSTTVAAGTLTLGVNNALPSTTAVIIAADENSGTGNGSTLNLNGKSQTISSLSSSTGIGGPGTYTPTLALGTSGALTINGSASTTFAGTISGSSGSLTLAGTGTLTLSGTNTFTGPLTIGSGTTLTITSSGGGTGKLNSGSYSGAITDNGTFNYNSGNVQTLSGIISGSGTLSVNPSYASGCILTLSGANTYAGATTIQNNGQVIITSDGNLGTAPLNLNASQLTLNFGFLNVQGTTTLNAYRGITLGSGFSFAGVQLGGSIQVAPSQTLTIAGPITGPSAMMFGSGEANFGYGTNLLTGSSSYTGPTGISTGRLKLGANGALPYGTTLEMAPDDAGGPFFDLNGFSQTIGPLSTTNQFFNVGTGTPTIVLTGPLTVLQTNTSTTFGGVITGSGGSLTINGNSSGTLTLTNANNYTGGTTITGGTLAGHVAGSIPGNVTNTGGVLQLDSTTAMSSGASLTLLGSPAPGAVNLNLSGGTQTINALYFGSIPQATGTWGASGSGAANISAAFTGNGLLQVNCTAPAQTITPTPSAVCANSTGNTASVPITAGASYAWSITGGTITAGGTSSTVTYTAGAGSAVTLNCVVTASCGVASAGGQNTSVTINPLPTVSVNSATVCAGGSATLTAGNNASSPTYLWNDPSSATTASITVSPASTTTYTVIVTDGTTGCANSGSGTVTVNPLPTASAGANQSICSGCGVAIGGSPTASGGSGGGYAYSWSPAMGLSSATVANPTASPAATTTYLVTVTDGNGCVSAPSGVTVTVANVAPAISAQPANTTVCSGSTTAFSVTASGSSLNYSWAINNNSGWGYPWTVTGGGTTLLGDSSANDGVVTPCASFSSADINSPVSGFALGLSGDAGNEVATRAFPALTAGQVVSIDFDNGNVDGGSKVGFRLQTAGGAANVLQFYALGGTGTYQYWDDVNGQQDTGIPLQVTGVRVQFALTCANTYVLTVIPCGLTATTFTGTYSGAAIAQLQVFNGNSAGGAADYCYFNNLIVGGYTDNADNYSSFVTGVDQGNQPIASANASSYTTPPLSASAQYQAVVAGCGGALLSSVASVTVNPLPTVSVNSETVCAGASATLTATISASNPTYLWSPGGATTASITVSPASTTVYTVTVTDGTTGCANSGSGTVTVNPNPTVAVNSQTVCASTLPATITATPVGTGPFSYAWTVPSGPNPGNVASFSASAAGAYSVVVTDANGCTGSGSGTLTVNPNPTVAVNSQAVCASALPATITATPVGTGPFNYAWTVPSGPNPGNVASFSASAAGAYGVVVTDANGCTGSGSGTLTVNPNPTVAVNSQTVCASTLPATITATPVGTGPFNYAWTVPSGPNPGNVASFSASAAGAYGVVVTDANGCTGSGSGTLTVNANPTADAGSAQTICAGTPVEIGGSPTANGGTGPYTYSWSPATGLDDATLANPTATVTSTTTYTVTVTDHNGCTANASVVVTVIPQAEITSIIVSGTDATLVWSSLSGQTYRVQYTADLTAPVTWTDLTGPDSNPLLPDVTASGATATFTDSSATDTIRFYQVSVVCP